jgi:hypothetical protein
VGVSVRVCKCMLVHAPVYPHTQTLTHIPTYTHTLTHTHTQDYIRPVKPVQDEPYRKPKFSRTLGFENTELMSDYAKHQAVTETRYVCVCECV